jgi:hypothetical protein
LNWGSPPFSDRCEIKPTRVAACHRPSRSGKLDQRPGEFLATLADGDQYPTP